MYQFEKYFAEHNKCDNLYELYHESIWTRTFGFKIIWHFLFLMGTVTEKMVKTTVTDCNGLDGVKQHLHKTKLFGTWRSF